MDVRIRSNEGCDPQPFLLWDSVWNSLGGYADWALAGFDAVLNRGGLRATEALETAVTIQLFTDKRCPPDHPLAKYADGDPRGWFGDAVDVRADLGETEMGSLLWLLETAALTADTLRWAESMTQDALAPILAQGAAARADVAVAKLPKGHGITIAIALYGRYGRKSFDRKFEIVWTQIGKR